MNISDFYADYMARMLESGVAAFIIQPYSEVNKKRGTEWEVSRSVSLSSVGQKVYSVLKVGSKPVDLKSRVLGATGAGVIGRAYKIQPSDVTINASATWYNYNTNGSPPESTISAQTDVTFNTPLINLAVEANKIHADIFAITNSQNQGKGFTQTSFGGNHILNPNDVILLEIESFDSSQTATAKVDIYEGELDFYP